MDRFGKGKSFPVEAAVRYQAAPSIVFGNITAKERFFMNKYITSADSLVTSQDEIQAGFLSIALEKNQISDPFVKQALAFRAMAAHTTSPDDFLRMPQIRSFMLTAAGLSEKSLQHLTEADSTAVIQELIDNFLKPAGNAYIDETIYRYLLTKGDAVGGSMRNRIGAMGQEKLVRCVLSCMRVRGMTYDWTENGRVWVDTPANDSGIEKSIKALHWKNPAGEDRVLGFNMTISTVKKNVDICLFAADIQAFHKGKIAKEHPEAAIMLGELKGGIDPAGADEHWKTANTALTRIRTSYADIGKTILTSFVGAAIEKAMAAEIYGQLQNNTLTNAANLTNTNQLAEYCNWLLDL